MSFVCFKKTYRYMTVFIKIFFFVIKTFVWIRIQINIGIWIQLNWIQTIAIYCVCTVYLRHWNRELVLVREKELISMIDTPLGCINSPPKTKRDLKKTGSNIKKISVAATKNSRTKKFFPSSFGAVVGSGMDKNQDSR
jgi:hypothetical protein